MSMSKTSPEDMPTWDSSASAAAYGQSSQYDDLDDEGQPILDHHQQHHYHPQHPSRKRTATTWSRLSICMCIIAFGCVAIVTSVLTVFFLFFEPCLNPYTLSRNNITYFAGPQGPPITLTVSASRSITFRSLPNGAESNRIDTNSLLSATSTNELEAIAVNLIAEPKLYSLNFTRPKVFRTLESCSNEEVTLSFSTSFTDSLNATVAVREGSIEILSLLNLQFAAFTATIITGSIDVGILGCQGPFTIASNSGNLKVAATTATRFRAYTGSGAITLNSPSASAFDIFTRGGDISVTSLTLNPTNSLCSMSIETLKGEIGIALINILSITPSSSCKINITGHTGSVNVAVKGFSGVFTASTLKGRIEVPGFEDCTRKLECSGAVGSDGAQNHIIEVFTELGSIQLIFV